VRALARNWIATLALRMDRSKNLSSGIVGPDRAHWLQIGLARWVARSVLETSSRLHPRAHLCAPAVPAPPYSNSVSRVRNRANGRPTTLDQSPSMPRMNWAASPWMP
jgi:hypothetical protein